MLDLHQRPVDSVGGTKILHSEGSLISHRTDCYSTFLWNAVSCRRLAYLVMYDDTVHLFYSAELHGEEEAWLIPKLSLLLVEDWIVSL